jgi:hypothetical protein
VAISPRKLDNLAARPPSFDEDPLDDQLADNSGVFRVTSAIAQAQIGHDEDDSLGLGRVAPPPAPGGRSPDESLEMRALDEEVVRANRQGRLATLAARARTTRTRK